MILKCFIVSNLDISFSYALALCSYLGSYRWQYYTYAV